MVPCCIRSGLLAALLVAGVAGCGTPDDIGATLTVTGPVTVDGKPLEEGTVTFHPDAKKENKTKAGVSGIVKNGEYTLTCASSTTTKPGAPPGWYKVTISTASTSGMNMSGKGNEVVKDKEAAKPGGIGLTKGKDQPIAAKYTDVSTTPLEIEVKSGGKYDLPATSK